MTETVTLGHTDSESEGDETESGSPYAEIQDSALQFNGDSQYVSTNYQQSLVDAYSIAVWVKPSETGFWWLVCDEGPSSGCGFGLNLEIDSGVYVVFAMFSNGVEVGVVSDTTISEGQWSFIAGTWSAAPGTVVAPTQFNIYINGNNLQVQNAAHPERSKFGRDLTSDGAGRNRDRRGHEYGHLLRRGDERRADLRHGDRRLRALQQRPWCG